MTLLLASASGTQLSWNFWSDIRQLFAYHFMINALEAASIAAVLAGVAGWCMVLRRQTFVGHTLSVVAFPGAAGATWVGISPLWGYFGFCLAAAMTIAGGARRDGGRGSSEESAVTGILQAFALACGFLFVVLYKGFLNETQSLLFGTFLGITDSQVLVLAVVAMLVLGSLAALGRRLFFASVDPVAAAAQGVPTRLVGLLFLASLGLAVAEVSQITGALLVFALLVMPASAAQRLSARPGMGLLLSIIFALIVVWVGLGISYFSTYPTGFWITSIGFAGYLAAVGGRSLVDRRARSVRHSGAAA